MHLSRFITIDICAITRTTPPPPAPTTPCPRPGPAMFRSWSRVSRVPHLLAASADDGHLVALVPGRPQVVERVGELGVAAREMRRLEEDARERVVDAAAQPGRLCERDVDRAVGGVEHVDRALGHAVADRKSTRRNCS